MAIKPVTIPSAGALEFGRGDVRHFSEGDALGVAELQTPSRMLAQRDVLLATSLNEVIAALNNQEQYVPLPVMRTVLSPSSSEVVANYRIPKGFEARVLNAAISSIPASAAVSLKVVYSPSFGSVAGVTGSTEVVNTTAETESGGVQFNPFGEFIVTILNSGGVSVDVVASVVLTMRPLGGSGGLLVGTPMQGERGQPGVAGADGRGLPGASGVEGPPGKLGFQYRGLWVAPASGGSAIFYYKNDVVSYAASSAVGVSSYIALRDITRTECLSASVVPIPTSVVSAGGNGGADYPWTFLAQAGTASTAKGAQGDSGSDSFRVAVVAGTATVSQVAGAFDSLKTDGSYVGFRHPVTDAALWLATPPAGAGPSNVRNFSLVEATIAKNDTWSAGMAFLYGSGRFIGMGSIDITLPVKGSGNSVDWGDEPAPGDTQESAINVTVVLNGTAPVFQSNGTVYSPTPWIEEFMTGPTSARPNGQHTYRVHYSGTVPAKMDIMVFGVRKIGSISGD